LTRPTAPRAIGRSFSGTSCVTCQRTAAFCIIEPVVEKTWPSQSRRKLRWRREEKFEAKDTGGAEWRAGEPSDREGAGKVPGAR
jgi:hypothetical protein